jgi:nitrite reductase/ring-hydroxylating ferredoxin subunit
MLSREDNELLTRVGPGTPTGELYRRYWIPALLSEEIREPDGPPVRVRLLGEDLLAFRDTKGRVGLIDEYCSHRRAPLFYGRNEECGLRCIYHGWKYDVDGNILETPAEPPESTLKDHLRHTAYPCREAAGVVFTYMGPKEKMPLLPNFDWITVPAGHVGVTKFFLDCNYLQAIEGDCDTSHVGYLHLGNRTDGGDIAKIGAEDRAPKFENEVASYGIRSAAIRTLSDGMRSIDLFSYIMPFIACVPAGKKINGKLDGFLVVYQTPSDDYHTWRYNFRFKRSEPMTEEELAADRFQVGPHYKLIANRDNHYLMDRQKHRNYSGMEGFATQDACITEGMGPIVDRTREHLGASDGYIVAVRLFLLKAVRDLQRGIEPPGLVWDPAKNDFSKANCTSVRVPAEVSWKEAEQRMHGLR